MNVPPARPLLPAPARAAAAVPFLVVAGVLAAWAARAATAPAGPAVAVLDSESSFRVSSWIGRWETGGAVEALRRMGLHVRTVSDADLAAGRLADARILVVPNARCVSRAEAAAAERFVAGGGRLLATEMAGYRDQDNRRVGTRNDFLWSGLIGASFQRWVSGWPHCEYLALAPALGREVAAALGSGAAPTRIELGRNTAMLVSAHADATVLAIWLNADGTPTRDAGSTGAALVQSADGRAVYCGENLLAPELSRSPQVEALLLALLRRLDAAAPAPGAGRLPERLAPAVARAPAPFVFPDGCGVPVPARGETIRVGVRDATDALGVSARDGLKVAGLSAPLRPVRPRDGAILQSRPGQVLQLRVVAPLLGEPYVAVYDDVRLLERAYGTGVRVAPLHRDGPVQSLDLRPNGTCRAQGFRGTLEVLLAGGHMTVVNLLTVEEYVAGVVPNEVPASTYPTEAVRAMAVVARTFGLARRGTHRAQGYDVCSTVHCQMYGGMLTEVPAGNRAVDATAGEVIRWHGQLADATFHAVCGGMGEAVERVWPQDSVGYLAGGPDGPFASADLSSDDAFRDFIDHPPDAWCSASPRFRWTERYPLAQLQALFEKSLPVTLGAAYHGLGTLREVRVVKRSPLGRVQVLEIQGSQGTYQVEKDRIRWLWSGGVLGQGGLQSTLFYILADGDARVFHGGGWGHGVGMCQDGAAGMADHGFDHRAIIAHYYPGTQVGPDGNGGSP